MDLGKANIPIKNVAIKHESERDKVLERSGFEFVTSLKEERARP
jgi:hypothetical protein